MILFVSNSQFWASIVDTDQKEGFLSQSTLFVIQFAGITLMAKPYYSDFKIITAIVQVPQIFWIFAGNVADFNLARLILLKKICLNNVEHLYIILGKPKA